MFLLKPFFRSLISILLLTWFLPTIQFSHWVQPIIVAFTLMFSLIFLKPIVRLLLMPLSIVTWGSFSILVHTGMFWFATFIVPGFKILPMTAGGYGFGYWTSLIVTSMLYSILCWILKFFIK